MRLTQHALLLLLSTSGLGCFATKMSSTARTLGEGNNETSLSFNTSQIFIEDQDSLALPNLIPNFHWAVGMNDNTDLYGNVSLASWYTEVGIKRRILQSGANHLSLAPLLGISPLGSLASYRMGLPVLYTRDLSETVGLNLMAHAEYRIRGAVSESGSSGEDLWELFGGDTVGVGGGLGVEVQGRAFYVRPAISYTYYSAAFGSEEERTAFAISQVAFTFGRVGGRTEAQLQRIEDKLDEVLED